MASTFGLASLSLVSALDLVESEGALDLVLPSFRNPESILDLLASLLEIALILGRDGLCWAKLQTITSDETITKTVVTFMAIDNPVTGEKSNAHSILD